jgi:HAD superfamily hydrolase (TIGR01509 family)
MLKKPVKAILWDNDGVLVDTEKLFYAATGKVLKTVGVDLTAELFIEFSLVKGKGLEAYLEHAGIDTAVCEELRKLRNDEYSLLLKDQASAIDGVRETLEILAGKCRMGIVTSSRRNHFEIIHRSTGILKFFEFVLTSDDYTHTKPDPEPYLLGLEKMGVEPGACIAVEDSARGLLSANRAGLKCLMIPNYLSRPETYRGDYTLLKSVKDVPGVLGIYRG